MEDFYRIARPVEQYTWGRGMKKVFVGNARFLSFGVDYEDLGGHAGTFSTAIIELPDGSVENVPLDLIKFTDFK